VSKQKKWEGLKNSLISILKVVLVKYATKLGGAWSWILTIVVEQLYSSAIVPAINWIFRKTGKQVDILKGKKVTRKVENAESKDDWRSNSRDA
jgi:membrane glycosyltransferase